MTAAARIDNAQKHYKDRGQRRHDRAQDIAAIHLRKLPVHQLQQHRRTPAPAAATPPMAMGKSSRCHSQKPWAIWRIRLSNQAFDPPGHPAHHRQIHKRHQSEADRTKISVTGSIRMNCPGTPGQNSIGRKAHSVVAVELTTGQNIRLAAAT